MSKNYIEQVNENIKKYYSILSKDFPQFLNDYIYTPEMQKSTEEETLEVIKNSKEIMSLLKRDKINLEEVSDYKIYPIADNETPKLSADRLEYTFMNGIYYKKVWDLSEIKDIYEDIQIIKNENDIPELGFKSIENAEKFINGASELWYLWISSQDTITMYFFADIIEKMYKEKYITRKDLYELSEQKIINKIINCPDKKISNLFNKFMNCNSFVNCEEYKKDKFCVSRKVKRRYINPITSNGKRIYDASNKSKEKIDSYINMKISKYAYVDM